MGVELYGMGLQTMKNCRFFTRCNKKIEREVFYVLVFSFIFIFFDFVYSIFKLWEFYTII